MKTLVKLFAVLLVLVSTVAIAGEKATTKATATVAVAEAQSPYVYKVHYESPDASDVQISIWNSTGAALYAATVSGKPAFMKYFNFADLPKDTYVIKLVDGSRIQVLEVDTKDNTVAQVNPETQPLSVNVTPTDEPGKYRLTVIGDIASAVRVGIYDKKGTLVKEDEIATQNSFSRVYNFSQLKSGDLKFTVAANGQMLSKSVK